MIDPYEAKYQYLINIREKVGINHFNDPKLSSSIQMICMMFTKILMNTIQIKNVKYYAFDDMIADMINNKKLNSVVTELFIRGRKLNISLVFITQSYLTIIKKGGGGEKAPYQFFTCNFHKRRN